MLLEQNLPLGLDISDYKIRLVQLKKHGKKIKLASFSEISVPKNVINDGVIMQPVKLVGLINQLKSEVIGARLLNNNKVIVGLPEKQSIIKITPIDKIDPEAVEKEMIKHLPFQINEIYYDFQIINNFLSSPAILYFAACRKNLVSSYLTVLNQANLVPEVFEIETEAMARCLFLPTDKFAYIVVDIGLARSTIFITYQKIVIFSISFSSIIFENKAYISELINHLHEVFEYYQEHLANYFKINAIITCGTGAHIKNLNEELQSKFPYSAVAGNPWQNIKNNNDHLINKIKYPYSYATAIGLALRPALNKNYL